MENIKIVDNFLNNDELNKFIQIINTHNWKYGHSSGSEYEHFDNKFFAAYDLGDYFENYMMQKLEFIFKKKFKLDRNYMHVQTYGQNGSYHTDTNIDTPNTYTFCIYITDIPDKLMENADGDFLIKIPNSKAIISIHTIMNRGVFFPSTYVHKGMAYNRYFHNKRLCITWKLMEMIE